MTDTVYEDIEFPFKEIRNAHGDYFQSIDEAMKQTGLGSDHVWSVTCDDDCVITGPSHHYVNLLGYFVTNEAHDNNTYYLEYPWENE